MADSDLAFEWSRRIWLPISRSPRAFPWYVRAQRRRRNVPAVPPVQIAIDGFPRSANTFSSRAFMFVNPDVKVSHHMHAPASILLAAQHNIPAIVVIRSPRDAVLSEVIREPRKRLKRGLLEWNSFYGLVRPVLGQVVVADFTTVTSDYAVVIDEVNRRYGTSFAPYVNSPERDEEVFASIEAGARARGKSGSRLERQVPRPSKERAEHKAALQAELDAPDLRPLVERGESLYADFAAVAPRRT
ncbi:MAG TPA: hypothetical protein VH914_09870 [Acidimicrobiia bacterium]|nr:hypothetical protein [Acidimicrobiia bacterium]